MSIESIWTDLRSQSERPVFRRVDDSHPYDLYLGVSATNTPVLMLISSISVDHLPRLRALDIAQSLRNDGRFAILITLAAAELINPFIQVCEDLIESLRSYQPPGKEALFFLSRLEKWRRLMEETRKGLSKQELLGLAGELLFLRKLIAAIGGPTAIQSWLGPEGAPQDFQIGERLFEIKVNGIGSHTVLISSIEQLHTGTAPAVLVVFSIGTSAEDQSPNFSLNLLIAEIREQLSADGLQSAFDSKLRAVGYDHDQPECDSLFLVQLTKAFDIRDQFPRLTPTNLPGAIRTATYSIDLDQCLEFENPLSQVPGYES